MNEFDRMRNQAKRYKAMYPAGTRIMLLHMGDDPRPVEDNTRGTVNCVDDIQLFQVQQEALHYKGWWKLGTRHRQPLQ